MRDVGNTQKKYLFRAQHELREMISRCEAADTFLYFSYYAKRSKQNQPRQDAKARY